MDEVLSKAAKAMGKFATGHAIVIGVANYSHGLPLPDAVAERRSRYCRSPENQ